MTAIRLLVVLGARVGASAAATLSEVVPGSEVTVLALGTVATSEQQRFVDEALRIAEERRIILDVEMVPGRSALDERLAAAPHDLRLLLRRGETRRWGL